MSSDSNQVESTLIDSKVLYDMLIKKGITNFHHANTARSSLTFISEKALLSREYIERNGLVQTAQYTDEKDKKLDIWDAVFLDGLDLHKKFSRRNKYGPILFHISLRVLLNSNFPFVRVTKNNPSNWPFNRPNFYTSIQDIEKDYLTGDNYRDGGIMFLFDKPQKDISLDIYCEKIIVDDPRIVQPFTDGSKKLIAELVKETIENALKINGLPHIPVEIRHPDLKHCGCYFLYKRMFEYHRDKFDILFSKR